MNFALSAVRVLWHIAHALREDTLVSEVLRKRVQVSLRLIRIFGGIGLVGDFFVFVLSIDVLHNLISAPSSKGAVLFAVVSLLVILALCLGVYKKVLSLFWHDLWAPLLLLLAIGLGFYILIAFP